MAGVIGKVGMQLENVYLLGHQEGVNMVEYTITCYETCVCVCVCIHVHISHWTVSSRPVSQQQLNFIFFQDILGSDPECVLIYLLRCNKHKIKVKILSAFILPFISIQSRITRLIDFKEMKWSASLEKSKRFQWGINKCGIKILIKITADLIEAWWFLMGLVE